MKLSSHDHGNCELCGEQEARIAELEKALEISERRQDRFRVMGIDETAKLIKAENRIAELEKGLQRISDMTPIGELRHAQKIADETLEADDEAE